MSRTFGALFRLACLAAFVGIVTQQALAAGWSPRFTFGLLIGIVIFAAGAAILIVHDARRSPYATDRGERAADSALAEGWPDNKDLDPEDCR